MFRCRRSSTASLKRLLGAALALAVVGAGASAATASADSTGCTFVQGTAASYVCLTINSGPMLTDGAYVSWFRVRRVHLAPQPTSICDYKGRVWVKQPTKGTVNYYSPYRAGCSSGVAWVRMYPRRKFEMHTKACGTWFESGRWLSGAACNYLKVGVIPSR